MGQNSTLLKSIVISIGAGIVLYILVLALSGYQQTVQAVNLLSLGDWGLVLALSLLHFLVRFLRWQWYLGRLGHRVPWAPSAACYMAGFALTATPGKLGETVRSLYLKPYVSTIPTAWRHFLPSAIRICWRLRPCQYWRWRGFKARPGR